MSSWTQIGDKIRSEPRFGVDQWFIYEDDNQAELERWPETPNGGQPHWRLYLAATNPLRFTHLQSEPLDEQAAIDWATQQRDDFLRRSS